MIRNRSAFTRITIAVMVATTLYLGLSSTVTAQEDDHESWNIPPNILAEATQPKGFFHIAPMVGATGIYGDVTAQGQSAEVEFSPLDAAESLDLDVGVGVEVGYKHTSVLADMRYLHAVTDQAELDDADDARVDLRHFVSHLALHRTFSPHQNFDIGPVGGLRIIYSDARLGDDDALAAQSRQTWVEPVIGLRGRLELGEVFFIPYHADLGGLGIGSRITWQAYGALGFNVNGLDLELGYRHMYLDLDDTQAITYDLNVGGPTLQAVFRY